MWPIQLWIPETIIFRRKTMANSKKQDSARTGHESAPTNPEGTPTSTNFGSTSATSNPQTGNLNQSTAGRDFNTTPDVPTGTKNTSAEGDYHFRCADVGFNECKWETRGNSPDEVLRNAEQHGRQQHNLTNIDDDIRNRVRSQIHKAA